MSSSDDDFYTNAASKLAKLNAKSSEEEISNDDDEISIKSPIKTKKVNSEVVNEKNSNKKIKNKTTNRRTRRNVCNNSNDSNSDDGNFISLFTDKKRRKSKCTREISKNKSAIINETSTSTNRTSPLKSSAKKKTTKRTPKKKNRNSTKNSSANTSVILISDNENNTPNNDQSITEINCEYNIKVWWQFRDLNIFKIRKYEKLNQIFEYYSNRENISTDRLLFIVKDKIIKLDDTPASLEINSSHIIEGGYVNEEISQNLVTLHKNSNATTLKQSIQLKILLKDSKKPLNLAIKKTDTLEVLMGKCSEELQIDIKKLKFYFDGDLLKRQDTPERLGFEGGECIDVFIT